MAKHRSGSVDDVEMRFIGKYAKFQNWDDNYSFVQETVDSKLNASSLDDGSFKLPPSGGIDLDSGGHGNNQIDPNAGFLSD